MQKRHFELIAKVLRDQYNEEGTEFGKETVRMLAQRFAGNLANLNPRFERERFIAAATRSEE